MHVKAGSYLHVLVRLYGCLFVLPYFGSPTTEAYAKKFNECKIRHRKVDFLFQLWNSLLDDGKRFSCLKVTKNSANICQLFNTAIDRIKRWKDYLALFKSLVIQGNGLSAVRNCKSKCHACFAGAILHLPLLPLSNFACLPVQQSQLATRNGGEMMWSYLVGANTLYLLTSFILIIIFALAVGS